MATQSFLALWKMAQNEVSGDKTEQTV